MCTPLYAYQDWCRYQGFDFKVERYPVERRLPYIPTEQQLDQLISSASNKYAPFLQLAKESGWRPIEISRLTPQDFDLNQQIATLNKSAKNSLPRQIKMSNKLTVMIKQLVLDTPKDERIWKAKPRNIEVNYIRIRNKASEKFGDSDITKITLKTFRHFKATLEYHRTKDILYLQKILGHKNIQSTLIYTHLVEWEDDNWIVKVAETLEEEVQLLEAGFEYVTDYEDKKLFRKRK